MSTGPTQHAQQPPLYAASQQAQRPGHNLAPWSTTTRCGTADVESARNLRRSALDGNKLWVHLHAWDEVWARTVKIDEAAHDRVKGRMHAPRVVRFLKGGLQSPSPVLDDVITAGPHLGEEQLEALNRRDEHVRAVVDDKVEGLQAGNDLQEPLVVGLACAPMRRYPAHGAFLPPPGEVSAVAPRLLVDCRVTFKVERLGPKGGATAVPDAEFQDAPGPKRCLEQEAVKLFKSLSRLEEDKRVVGSALLGRLVLQPKCETG